MLEASWEVYAAELANAPDNQLQAKVDSLVSKLNIDTSVRAHVVIGRDSRESGPALVAALEDGLKAMNANYNNYGLLTTPSSTTLPVQSTPRALLTPTGPPLRRATTRSSPTLSRKLFLILMNHSSALLTVLMELELPSSVPWLPCWMELCL